MLGQPSPAFYAFAGHDHSMQRLRPADGLTQYASGAGGRKRYALRRPRPAFGQTASFGALRIELSPGRARTAFVSAAGRILDVHTLRRTRKSAHEPAASGGR